MACRDCDRCTEMPIKGIILGPLRGVWRMLTFWNIGLFQKRCPECGHLMALHQKRADGSFRD